MAYEYPQVMAPEKFKDFLEKIRTIGTPKAFDAKALKSLGYTSSHDLKFINALKFIGLVDNKRGGAPTELWKEMRGNPSVAFAKAVRSGYQDLFSTYPDANLKDSETLSNYFAANTHAPKDSIQRMVATFQSLCHFGDFDALPAKTDGENTNNSRSSDTDEAIKKPMSNGHRIRESPSITINIQLQLPPDATGEVYEKFFEAMQSKLKLFE